MRSLCDVAAVVSSDPTLLQSNECCKTVVVRCGKGESGCGGMVTGCPITEGM